MADCLSFRRLALLALAIPVGYAHGQDVWDAEKLCRPILVISDDEDTDTVLRSTQIAKMARDEFAVALESLGFRVLHEDWWSAKLGFGIEDRDSLRELLGIAELLAQDQPYLREIVALRIVAFATRGRNVGQVVVQVGSRAHDVIGRERSATVWQEESTTTVANACLDSPACLIRHVSREAQQIAGSVGLATGRWLDSRGGAQGGASEERRVRVMEPGSARCYVLTLEYFEDRSARDIVRALTEDVPADRYLERIAGLRYPIDKYFYVTTSDRRGVEELLMVLLEERGIEVGREVVMEWEGDEITITRLFAEESQESDRT